LDVQLSVTAFEFPLVLDLVATIAWATSGAIVARARGFDYMGVIIVAIISATGGGLLRDGLFLNRTPVMVTTVYYVAIPIICAVVITLFGSLWESLPWWPLVVNAIDAIGTPAFGVLGFQLSVLAGIPLIGALFIGLVNGVSGGILRDVLVGDIPQIFRPGQFSGLIVIAAMALYALLVGGSSVSSDGAAWFAITVAAVARLLVIRFNWQSRPASDYRVQDLIDYVPDITKWPQWARGRSYNKRPKRRDDDPPNRAI
jgi:uncharacterized membrane protein YeiH